MQSALRLFADPKALNDRLVSTGEATFKRKALDDLLAARIRQQVDGDKRTLDASRLSRRRPKFPKQNPG
jgi:hypothetical protein